MSDLTTELDVRADAPATPATLLIESAQKLDVHRLNGETTIGRDRRCTIVLDHPTVSRNHARLFRSGRGWHFEDLGSQNGSRIGDMPASSAAALLDGIELRIGRVRAWFFSATVPPGWVPSNVSRLAGKLIRCSCGHIGWAPLHSGDGTLRCSACGKEMARRDPDATARILTPEMVRPAAPPAVPLATVAADCAACHTTISVAEPMHTCPECAATMHADCWTENRGCATYGCPQVGVLDEADATLAGSHVHADDDVVVDAQRGRIFPIAVSDSYKQSLMAVIVFGAAGLLTFGVPPVGYAAYQLVGGEPTLGNRRRFMWAAISFVAGIVGFICSWRWWLGSEG